MAENTIQWDKDADGIVTLTLDDPTGSANVMNDDFQNSIHRAVQRLVAEQDSITGVVITSVKKTFFAGGDLKWMMSLDQSDAAEAFDTVERVKADLRKLESAPATAVDLASVRKDLAALAGQSLESSRDWDRLAQECLRISAELEDPSSAKQVQEDVKRLKTYAEGLEFPKGFASPARWWRSKP